MVDNNRLPSRDQAVLEYLNGGVTYRQLAAKYGLNRMTICHWVHQHQGIFHDRTQEYQQQKSTKHTGERQPPLTPPPPLPAPPTPPPNPLAEPLRQAQLKIALLEELIRIAQNEHGLVLPKKPSTAPAARQAVKAVGQQQSVSVSLLCPLLGLSRQAYYDHFRQQNQQAYQLDALLAEVARIRHLLPRLGTRKLYHKLKPFLQQHGWRLGRDSLFALLAQQGLLIRRQQRTKPRTTYSQHSFRRYPNLLIDRTIEAPHQVWVVDITYLPTAQGFAYLFLVTDAYSRKIIDGPPLRLYARSGPVGKRGGKSPAHGPAATPCGPGHDPSFRPGRSAAAV